MEEEPKHIDSANFYETLTKIFEHVEDIKVLLICIVIFIIVQCLLYGGFLFYLLQIRPR